ncbi:hypothetical protein GGI17_005739 [Coemansia sp. S146]|nr:hypothetical protein GGI17_005739 [Coemansia sp. S146]
MTTLDARHRLGEAPSTSTTIIEEPVPAYSMTMLLQLCTLEAALVENREATRQVRISTEESLRRARRVQRLRQQVSATAGRVAELRQRLGLHTRRVEAASDAVETLTERKAAVQERVREAERELQRIPDQISSAVIKLRQDRIILEDLRAMLARQRAVVAQQLLFIFPIDIGDISKAEEEYDEQGAVVRGDAYGGWSICGLSVIGPDSVRRWQDSEETAAALGLVTRVVDAVSRLMCTPLRFPVVPRGSRSTICNPMAKATLTTQSAALTAVAEWPLYMLRANDRPRLHMAVRLLSVCIEQFLCQHGVVDVDRHQLLPNLVQLLLAIEGCSFAL